MAESDLETTCQEVEQLLKSNTKILLLDCREAEEFELVNIDGAYLLPMSELMARQEEIADKRAEHIVVYCHHGMRSAQVATWLRQQGYAKAQSMAGGIDQWSQEIDATLTRY